MTFVLLEADSEERARSPSGGICDRIVNGSISKLRYTDGHFVLFCFAGRRCILAIFCPLDVKLTFYIRKKQLSKSSFFNMLDFRLTVCDLETIMWLKRQKSYLQISMQTTSQTSFRQKRRGGNGGEEKAEREREIKSESWPNTLYSISRGRGRKKKVLLT